MLAPLQTGSRTLHPTRQAASFISLVASSWPSSLSSRTRTQPCINKCTKSKGRDAVGTRNQAPHNPPLRQASPPLPSLRGEGGIDACPSAGVLNPRSSLARNLYLPISIPSSHTDTLTRSFSPLDDASQSKLPLLLFPITRTEPHPVRTAVLPRTVRAPLTPHPEAGRPWYLLPPNSLDLKD